MKKRFCYLDETGHTGLNFFDAGQDTFIQGCTISSSDLDSMAKDELASLAASVGEIELHANELGNGKLNKISSGLIAIIEKHDLRFTFTVIEKRYYLAIALFHLIYDNGLNPAVSAPAQGIKILRMILALNFSSLVNEKNLIDFWDSTQKQDINLFVSVLEDIFLRLPHSQLDVRSKELLGDALAYAKQNPDEIFRSMVFDGGISANLAAFGMMINMINQTFNDQDVTVEKFVHDTQKQFGKYLKRVFPIFSRSTLSSEPLSSLTEISRVHVIRPTELVLTDSKSSAGLQITDIALWIFKRVLLGNDLSGVESLAKTILDRHLFDGVLVEHHRNFVASSLEAVNRMAFTDEAIDKGNELIAEFEKRRWRQPK